VNVSLIAFHRTLIAAAIVFCLGYGSWEIFRSGPQGPEGSTVLGTVFIVLGLGLGYYLLRLNHFLGYDRSVPQTRSDR
jgi:hypothetical protein